MSHTTAGYINAPIDLKGDMQYIITGYTSGDAAFTSICNNSHVNLWATHKSTDGSVTGVTPKSLSLIDLPSYCNGHQNGWVRKTPVAPYSMIADWDGYYHRGAPCTGFYTSGTPDNSFSSYFTVAMTIYNSTTGILNLTTLIGRTCYFGVYCVGVGNSETHRKENSTAVASSGGDTFRVSTASWTAQTYKVYPYIMDSNGTFYSVPNIYYDQIYVKEAGAPSPQIPITGVYIYDDWNSNLNGQTVYIPLTSGTYQLRAQQQPSNATSVTYVWSTRNSAIATISTSGLVTLKSKGTVIIALTANGASSSTASANMTLVVN